MYYETEKGDVELVVKTSNRACPNVTQKVLVGQLHKMLN